MRARTGKSTFTLSYERLVYWLMRAVRYAHAHQSEEEKSKTKEQRERFGARHWDLPENRLCQALSAIPDIRWCGEYAEPGYRNGEPIRGILFFNWNLVPKWAGELLERLGYELEWADEWTTCDDCGKAIRTAADSHGWQRYYTEQCGAVICVDCTDWSDVLEHAEDRAETAVPYWCDPSKYGYKRLSQESEYQNGFHPGQTDTPEEILKTLKEQGVSRVVFRVSDVGQFDVSFETWVWRRAEV